MLNCCDLCIARGGLPILEGLTFGISAGELLVLRGPNGIGKTTLLRCFAGLQPALSGQLDVPPESIAYAAHSDGLKGTLTVAENLRFWADIFGANDINAALKAFDLEALSDRQAQNLSAGQKRRLGLSRLVLTQRPLWILDEPTVSMDRAAVALFAAALENHLKGGGGAIVATHIDLGITGRVLDLAAFRADPKNHASGFEEAFL